MKGKWKVSMPDLKKWAQGQTFRIIIYMEDGKIYAQTIFHRYIQLTDKGQTIEFDNGEGDISEISRECLEDLALKGQAYDSECGIDYYTREEFEKQVEDGNIVL